MVMIPIDPVFVCTTFCIAEIAPTSFVFMFGFFPIRLNLYKANNNHNPAKVRQSIYFKL